MRTDDFNYELPPASIAQHPAQPRDSSRLLILRRDTNQVEHATFHDLPTFLSPGDRLVLNETRVLPGRLTVRKEPGGGRAELLLLKPLSPLRWVVMVGGKGMRIGRSVVLPDQSKANVIEDLGGTRRVVEFDQPIEPRLPQLGEMPLPPYIHEALRSPDEYQTVYARRPGSAAAPTAGLHFTPELFERLQASGIGLTYVTLHVGMDTFAPVTESDPRLHALHSEWCTLSAKAAEEINHTRAQGRRVIAVGTTSVRTLETAARVKAGPEVDALMGPTELFILPGFTFQTVDSMITNFHLPRSTLLMLVSAFAGRERILSVYSQAIQHGYRFYSFGDAMLIL